MKKLTLLCCLSAAAMALTACPGPQPVPDEKPTDQKLVTRATPELPTVPADVIAASGIEDFDVDGIQVILKKTPGKSVVSAQLFVDGGAANITDKNAGIEELALSVATTGGTKNTPRDQFNARLNAMGSSIGASSNRDYSVISMFSIRPFFEDTWGLFAEVVSQPAFDEKQFDLVKERTVQAIAAENDDPDDAMGNTAADLFFDGHPYKIHTSGTLESVKPMTRQDIITFYQGLLTRERLTLVVVGDVDRAAIEAGIKAGLGNLPTGTFKRPDLDRLSPGKADLAIDERELPTNYMLGYFTAPSPFDPDYYPMLVATNVLSDRLFEEIRTRRNLTYAVSAGLGSRPYNYGYLYITTVKPNEAIPVMYAEIDRLAKTPLDAEQMNEQVQLFLTEHFMRQETNAAQASTLGRYELTGGGWEQSLVFIDRIQAVTPEQVQAAANGYFKNIHWGFVGKAASLDKSVVLAR